MSTILVSGEDFAAIRPVRGVAEGLGLAVIHAHTTENIVEDVVLNEVALVIAQENSQPFDAWALCSILRADPSVPRELPIVLMHGGDINPRRFEKAGFSGQIAVGAPAAVWIEEIVRQMKESYDPLAGSGFQ